MRKQFLRSIWKSALLLGVLFAHARIAQSQALLPGQRVAEIVPFAQTTLVSPDWGPTRNLGYTIGLDYTRFTHSMVQPSVEVRYNRASGTTVNERSYIGGLKLQTFVHGVRPYTTILGGHGNIDFNYPDGTYNGDNSFVLSLGGGAEFNATHHFELRADFTYQFWNIDPQTLSPMTFGVGIAYRLPFHDGTVR